MQPTPKAPRKIGSSPGPRAIYNINRQRRRVVRNNPEQVVASTTVELRFAAVVMCLKHSSTCLLQHGLGWMAKIVNPIGHTKLDSGATCLVDLMNHYANGRLFHLISRTPSVGS